MSRSNDVNTIVNALAYLANAMTRPKTWELLTKRAGVSLDRPSATILHMLEKCSNDNITCNVNELAQHLGIEAPSVSRKVQDLEQSGLVARKSSAVDRRTVVLAATAKGRKMLDRIQAAKRDSLAELLHKWSAADRKDFAELSQRLAEDMTREHQPL